MELVNRFGPTYANTYGWAANALGKEKPNFDQIEKIVDLDHLRPYYKLASHNVHAQSKGIFFSLGLPDESDILLAGMSDIGLADPGHGAAISLFQITNNISSKRAKHRSTRHLSSNDKTCRRDRQSFSCSP